MKIWAQLVKELIQLSRDRLTLALGFLLPLATLVIFGAAIRMEAKNIPLAIEDFDCTPQSRRLVECLLGTNQLQIAPLNGKHVLDALDSGKAKVGIIIPPGFARKLAAGQTADFQVIINGIDINNARVIKNSVLATASYFSSQAEQPGRVNTQLRLIFNPGRAEPLFMVPGIYAVVLAIYPAFLAAIAMVRETEHGTMIQVYASSIKANEFLLGKVAAYVVVGFGQAAAVMISGFLLFHVVPLGDPLPLIICTFLYITINVLLGTFLGTLASGQLEAVQAVATVQFMTALLLSGFLYPRSTIPVPLSWLSSILPASYYIEVARSAFVRGTGWQGLEWHPLVLASAAALIGTAAWTKLRAMKPAEPTP